MSVTSPSVRGPTEQAPPRSKRSWLRWIVLGLIAIGAALVLWIALAGGNGPTASFDGQTVTYSGPTTVSAGDVTFTFDATEYANSNGVTFLVAELTDDSITMAAIESAAASIPASSPPPPFVGTYHTKLVVEDKVEQTYSLTEGRWVVNAHTAPQDTDRVHPAVILEVTTD